MGEPAPTVRAALDASWRRTLRDLECGLGVPREPGAPHRTERPTALAPRPRGGDRGADLVVAVRVCEQCADGRARPLRGARVRAR